MKKTLLITSMLMFSNSFASDYWQGCGNTAQEAKEALAQNIMVQVDSSFSQTQKSSFFLGLENFSNDVETSNKQKSTLLLNNLELFSKDGQSCVKVNKNELHDFTKSKLQNLDKDYKISALSLKDKKLKAKTIDKWLEDLKFFKGLVGVFKDLRVEKVNDKIKTLQNMRKDLYLQSVTINKLSSSDDKNLILKIDNKKREFSKKIYLQDNKEHIIEISGSNICKFSKSFNLSKEEDKTISVNLDEQRYPTFTISANKAEALTLKIGSKNYPLGKEIRIDRCDGVLNYQLKYNNGLPKLVSEDVDLHAGLKYHKSYKFKSFKEIKELNRLVDKFKKGTRLEIGYGAKIINDDTLPYSNILHTINISWLNYNNYLRHGFRVSYSEDSGNFLDPVSYGADLSYFVGLQLTTFGVDKTTLTLFDSFTLVPYIGSEVGGGFLKMYNNDTKEKDTQFYDNDDLHNYMSLKGVIGVDIALSQDIAFGIKYAKEFTILEAHNISFYMSLAL